MNGILEKLRAFASGFAYGRNGSDELARTFLVAGMALTLVDALLGGTALSLLAFACLAYALFRTLSKNIGARRTENARFLDAVGNVKTALRRTKEHTANFKTTKYFTCKGCGQHLSVPKGKGTLRITCPKCGRTETIRS